MPRHRKKKQPGQSASDDYLEQVGYLVALSCAFALGPAGLKLIFAILSEHGRLNEAAFKAMFQVFILSAPLVFAVAVTTLSLMRDWFSEDQATWVGFIGIVWVVAVILSYVGVGIGPVIPRGVAKGGANPMNFIFNALLGYFEVYGPLLFISAVALGFWIAALIEKHTSEASDTVTLPEEPARRKKTKPKRKK